MTDAFTWEPLDTPRHRGRLPWGEDFAIVWLDRRVDGQRAASVQMGLVQHEVGLRELHHALTIGALQDEPNLHDHDCSESDECWLVDFSFTEAVEAGEDDDDRFQVHLTRDEASGLLGFDCGALADRFRELGHVPLRVEMPGRR